MKSILKLTRRFVSIMITSILLLVLLNFLILALFVNKPSPYGSPWNTAIEVANDLKIENHYYSLSDDLLNKLHKLNIWAMLIENDTQEVIWSTDNLPLNIPKQYSLSDISNLTRGYIKDYPTFTANAENGLLVLGYPKDSFWKHTRATWDYQLIANSPIIVLGVLGANLVLVLLIYLVVNARLLRSIKPIANGIQYLPTGMPVHINENGLLCDLAKNINASSTTIQVQKEELKKKDTARANWIAGVSHDIRTPLSMVMGYAGQLAESQTITEDERNKALIIVKQSERMKNLIQDLNLASKLEYNMQPIHLATENCVAVLRQIVVDFMNTSLPNEYQVKWLTDESLISLVSIDKDLVKRAVINIMQNCVLHNDTGCTIYVSIKNEKNECIITIEDDGIGVTNEKILDLNSIQHYMVCDSNTIEQRHGLGLLIVKQIINAHHGNITINHSSYGGFKVVLSLLLL